MIVFFVAAVVDVCGNVMFLIWGSAELQPWNEPYCKSRNSVELPPNASPPPYAVTA